MELLSLPIEIEETIPKNVLPANPTILPLASRYVVTCREFMKEKLRYTLSLGYESIQTEILRASILCNWYPTVSALTAVRSVEAFDNLRQQLIEFSLKLYDIAFDIEPGTNLEIEKLMIMQQLAIRLGVIPKTLEYLLKDSLTATDAIAILYNTVNPGVTCSSVYQHEALRSPDSKIVSLNKAIQLSRFIREEGSRLVCWVPGKFRFLHGGHVDGLLKRARQAIGNSGVLFVSAEADESINHRHDEPKVLWGTNDQRLRSIAGVEYVDIVFLQPPPGINESFDDFFIRMWHKILPNIMVVGVRDYFLLEKFRKLAEQAGTILLWAEEEPVMSVTELNQRGLI